MKEIEHYCWNGLDGVYKWIPRTEKPKSCPRCKARLDGKKSSDEIRHSEVSRKDMEK